LSLRSSPGTPERRILGAVAPDKDAPVDLEGSEGA